MTARDRVGLFGTGVMARGIARLCLENGFDVIVQSGSDGRAEELAASLGGDDARVSTNRDDVAGCSIFVEATVEEMEPKRRALGLAEEVLPPDALMASTTSSLSITDLAAALRRPGRMIGLHFFNPVHRMPLVEVVTGLRTDEPAVAVARRFVHALGKRPLRVP
ncbi:MAG: 3-hydroxyacyl-CoA dehydrogenase family protein, partial [Actinomycetota bacterium]